MEQTYIAIMIQSLEKKEKVLDRIIELDTIQKNQLEDPELTPDDFDEVVEAKSELIDQLDKLDSGFEKLFERMKDELDGNKEAHKDEIRIMKDHIRSITDKSVQIQSQEARNKDLMMKKFNAIKKQTREVRKGANVVSKYYQTMTKTGYVDPQFMDNKK
ncbi:flagellar protein FliT [Agathobacter sp.]